MTDRHGRFTVERWQAAPLRFTGELLAEVSTELGGALHWQEIRIYRVDDGGYVVEVVGRTRVPGEHDYINVKTYAKPWRVREGLYRKDVRHAPGVPRRRYLTDAALEALRMAHEADPTIELVPQDEIDAVRSIPKHQREATYGDRSEKQRDP